MQHTEMGINKVQIDNQSTQVKMQELGHAQFLLCGMLRVPERCTAHAQSEGSLPEDQGERLHSKGKYNARSKGRHDIHVRQHMSRQQVEASLSNMDLYRSETAPGQAGWQRQPP